MDPLIAQALGLPTTATPADAVTAINGLKTREKTALNAAQTPDPDRFVPKADHQTALNRAQTAEETVRKMTSDAREADIVSAVDDAIAAGKVTPASRDYYLSMCRKEDGLDSFKAHAESLPSFFAPSQFDRKPADRTATALNAQEAAVARAMNLSDDEFQATLAASR